MNVISNLTPWQLMLWIVCIEVLSVPILAVLFNTIFIGYYNAKIKFLKTMMNAFSKTIEQITKGMEEKKDG